MTKDKQHTLPFTYLDVAYRTLGDFEGAFEEVKRITNPGRLGMVGDVLPVGPQQICASHRFQHFFHAMHANLFFGLEPLPFSPFLVICTKTPCDLIDLREDPFRGPFWMMQGYLSRILPIW